MRVLLLFLLCLRVLAQQPQLLPAKSASQIQLRDQFDVPQELVFPSSNVVLLAIADRKGSDEVTAWIAALKPFCSKAIEIRGLADVRTVPGFLQGRIRKKFQESRTYPVMMDWSGAVCDRFAYRSGAANILVIDRDGSVRSRFFGAPHEAVIASARAALEKAVAAANAAPRGKAE